MSAEKKTRLRMRARAARQALPPAERATLSRRACERLLALPELTRLEPGSVVLGYAASAEELDLTVALDALRARDVRVALPRVAGASDLTLHECESADLEIGSFGIAQPCETTPEVSAREVDLVIVPGIAFDTGGHRIGYGAGYYDRLLASMSTAVFVGIGFDGQLVAAIPAEEHDVRMHRIVTPTRTVTVRT